MAKSRCICLLEKSFEKGLGFRGKLRHLLELVSRLLDVADTLSLAVSEVEGGKVGKSGSGGVGGFG
jgi:hypothetical protein